MRRYISTALITLCFILILGVMAFAKDTPVKVYVDGTQKMLSPSAFLRTGTVYVPLSAITKAVGGSVVKDRNTNDYLVTCGSMKTVVSKSRGIMVKGQFMVPMMIASTALDYASRWDKQTNSVYFTKIVNPKNQTPPKKPAGGG